jgi:hypothetical protein
MIKKIARFAFTAQEKGFKNMVINQVSKDINAPIAVSSF